MLTGCDSHPVFHAAQPSPATTDEPGKGSNAHPSDDPGDDPGDDPDPRTEPGAVDIGRMPQVIDHGPRTVKKVALTFDADMTDAMLANLRTGKVKSYANVKVLDILDQRRVPATFFLTGMWAEHYSELTLRIVHDAQFEIGNHTYRHSAYTPNCHGLPTLPRTEMTTDARRTFNVLKPFRGHQTRFFRFPGLCHDAAALTALAPLGVTVIDGDCVSGDPFATAAAPIVHKVLSTVQPGSIIVMHITEANAQFTDQALGPILDGLAERGLEPVRLSELLAAPRQP
jgi:peptidoglycan/xylan/chitin deacetylase (PgdA/CDA1 family)